MTPLFNMMIAVSGSKTRSGIFYKGYDLEANIELFKKSFDKGNKHHAEYLAVVHAIGYCVNTLKMKSSINIYTDSYVAIKWCNQKKSAEPKGEMKKLLDYTDFFLQSNTVPYQLLKWNDEFGINPARSEYRSDFMVMNDIEATLKTI